MKTTTRRWLLVATAATALVGCSSGEIPEGVSPDDTVAPIDGDSSSPTPRTPPPVRRRHPPRDCGSGRDGDR